MIIFAGINQREKWRGAVYSTTLKPITVPGVKRNLEYLAPTTMLVYGHKAGSGDTRFKDYAPLTDEQYTSQYWGLLFGERWEQVKHWLDVLPTERDVTFLCYCSAGNFCHRQLLAQLVKEWRPELEVVVY